ncbi:MAG: M3 family oligoendopeptidase [Thermodesulfobacteriota bacterium]|nr:M3 family oligoendopeptidase [Thermodesulfobacteriota bacterium]
MSSQLNQQLGTGEVIWNLDDLYESLDDSLIEDDIFYCEEEAKLLKDSFAGQLGSLEAEVFARTVRRLERIAAFMGRIATYASLYFSTRVNNPEASAFLQKVKEISSRIARETVFFELEWSQLAEDQADHILEAEETAHFHHYLQNIRRYAEHILSHEKETLLIEISPVGRSSWTNLFEKVMAHQEFGAKKRGQEEVLADLYSPDREVRKQAALDLTQGLQDQLYLLSHIFNTLLAEKMIDDRLRSYPSWINSRNLDNELEDETVTALIEATVSRYDIVQRYYRVKKSLLGLEELKDYDRYAPLANLPSKLISWDECRDMVLTGFHDFSPEMAEIASRFFEQKWIHAPIISGKRSGAFSHPGVPDVHPYVLVNYTGNLRDVSTVAHELGHGVHQYLAAKNGYFNSQTPLVLAETASVFAELLIFHNQLETLTDPEQRRAFTCQKLESIFATVFRQVSMNRFEDLIHNNRREEGELAPEKLTELWMTSQRQMFGDSVTLTDDYGLWWSYIPHFLHTPGYVYSYAFGELLVLSLYNLYKKEGQEFIPKYIHLLSQGGSLSPYELLAPFGIDLNDQTFWQGGLAIIDAMLESVERK